MWRFCEALRLSWGFAFVRGGVLKSMLPLILAVALVFAWRRDRQASEDQFEKFRARSSIDSLLGGADREKCPPEIYEETQEAFAESRKLNPHFGGRTVGMIGRRGTLATIKLMIGRKESSSDFESLRKNGRLNSSFEAIALRHPEHFSESELTRARQRLEEAGFDLGTLVRR